MADRLAITLHAFGAETTAGTGPSRDIGSRRSAAELSLRAAAVTGTLTVSIETSPDGNTWRSVGAFDAITAPSGTQKRAFDRLDQYVRASWPSGTSATFSVDGDAHMLFATRDDLPTTLPAAVLAASSDKVIAAGLIRGSSDAEDALGTVHDLPITQWSPSVTYRAAAISAYHIAMARGFAGGGIDELLVKGWDDAQTWFKRVAKREITAVGVEPEPDASVQSSSGSPQTPTDFEPRFSDNWGDFG